MATNSTWGNAHFGDEAEYRRKLAFAMALKRADQPILHPLQGINNVAREWMTALEDKQREDKLAGEQKSLTHDFVTANGIGSPPTVRQPQPASTAQPGSAAPTSPPNSFQGKPVIELPTKRVSPLSGAENVPPNLADALSAPSFDTAGAEGAPDAIDKKREPDAAVGLPPSQDAFSPQNAFSPPAKTTASQYGADTGPLHGKVSPQAVAASVAAMAQRRGWDGPKSSFTPEAVSGLMKQESAYRNAPPNPHRYAGYFQMRPGEFTPAGEYILNTKTYKGPTMTPADFAKMSYQEHQELYGNRLQALGYTGTQNLGVMNAAPAYKDRPDDFVAYRAGSREAMANPAWRNASGAGGAVTVGGIKNWHQAGSPQIAPSRQMAAAPWQRDPEALGGGGAPNNAAAFAPPDAQPPAQETIQPYRVAGNGNVAPPRFAQNNPPGGNMFSPTPTPGASFQSFERPPQANAVRSPAQAAAEEAAKAQRQMQIYGAGFQRTTNPDHKKIYFDAYKAAEEAYKAATTITQESGVKDGKGYTLEKNPISGEVTIKDRTPAEWDAAKRPIIDQGTHLGLLDPKTGTIDATFSKNIAATEQAKVQGKDRSEAQTAYLGMSSKMPGLEKVVGQLSDLSGKATYTQGGQLWDIMRSELTLPPREAAVARGQYMAIVDNQILPLLRATFGAQFTQKEGEYLRATLGAANSPPEVKRAVLSAFIAQKKMNIEADYYAAFPEKMAERDAAVAAEQKAREGAAPGIIEKTIGDKKYLKRGGQWFEQ